jgi:cell shape-determining protein MreD
MKKAKNFRMFALAIALPFLYMVLFAILFFSDRFTEWIEKNNVLATFLFVGGVVALQESVSIKIDGSTKNVRFVWYILAAIFGAVILLKDA